MALLKQAADVQPGDLLTPENAILDPFVLKFLDIKDEYSESDLEEALIRFCCNRAIGYDVRNNTND